MHIPLSFFFFYHRLVVTLQFCASAESTLASLPKLEPNAKRLYLCRHGETEANFAGLLDGQSLDSPLTADGVEQARLLGAELSSVGIQLDVVASSDLQRALRTADQVFEQQASTSASRPRREVLAGVREMHCGSWEGQMVRDVREGIVRVSKHWKEGRIQMTVCEGGESPAVCFERSLDAVLSLLRGDGRHVCVVAHSILNKILLAGILGGIDKMDQIPQSNCSISVVDFDVMSQSFAGVPGGLNVVSHLGGTRAGRSL